MHWTRWALPLIVLLHLVATPVQAHAGPDSPEPFVRLLHDHNDDSAFLAAQGKHGFDSIALDIKETWNMDAGEPEMVLRLLLNNGCSAAAAPTYSCTTLTNVISFNAPDGERTVSFVTDSSATVWTGDMDWYSTPIDLQDGTRFAIEAGIRFSALGLSPGDVLSDWFLTADVDGEEADNMPYGLAGEDDMFPTGPLAYDIGSYTLRDPTFYLSLTSDITALELDRDGVSEVPLTITNELGSPQSVQFTASVPSGIMVTPSAPVVDIDGGGTGTVTMRIAPAAEEIESGPVTLVATTSLGGVSTWVVDVDVEAAVALLGEGLAAFEHTLPAGASVAWKFTEAGSFALSQAENHATTLTLIEAGAHHAEEDAGNATDGAMEAEDGHPPFHAVTFSYVDGSWQSDVASLHIEVGDFVMMVNSADRPLALIAEPAHGHSHGDDDFLPGPGLFGLVAALGVALVVARRR